MEKINVIQQTILKKIFEGDFDHRDIAFIDFPIFGRYQSIFEAIKNIPKDELLEHTFIHNEFAKLNLHEAITEIMMCTYYSINPYKDIEYVCKTLLLGKSLDIEGSIESVRKLEMIRIELYKLMTNWESKNYSIDRVLDDSFKLSLTAKNKVGLLGYSTGLPTLDKYTDGLQKGTVMRLTAYSNIGKSKLSYHICNSLIDQKAKILYFSLEVKKEFVLYNLICNRYGVEFGDVSRGCWHDYDMGPLLNSGIEIIADKYNLDDIVRYCENKKPDVVFIDFVQNIRTESKSEYESMTEVATKIQQMAIQNNIAVFDLSQISNDGASYEFGGVIKSKGSGALVASADIGLVMQREKDTNHNLLYIAKNKFGTNTKCIDLKFNFPTGEIQDLGDHLLKSLSI